MNNYVRATVQRDLLHKNLVDYLTRGNLYKVVVGARGTGKSTAVRRALCISRFKEGARKAPSSICASLHLNFRARSPSTADIPARHIPAQ